MNLKNILEKIDSVKLGKNKEISLKDVAMIGTVGGMALTAWATLGWLFLGTSLHNRHVNEITLKHSENCKYIGTDKVQECYTNEIKECIQNHPLPNCYYVLEAIHDKSYAAANKLKNYVVGDKNEH